MLNYLGEHGTSLFTKIHANYPTRLMYQVCQIASYASTGTVKGEGKLSQRIQTLTIMCTIL